MMLHRGCYFLGVAIVNAAVLAANDHDSRLRGDAERQRLRAFQRRQLFDPTANGFTLSWRDDFDGPDLNYTNWSRGLHFDPNPSIPDEGPGLLNNGLYDGYILDANSYVENGKLVLANKEEIIQGTDPARLFNYTSGWVNTEGKRVWNGSEKSSYFEARMKFPSGSKVRPKIWMVPASGWPPEFDVWEYWGNFFDAHQDRMHNNIIYGTPSARMNSRTQMISDFSLSYSGFHTYGWLWTSLKMEWYVDGILIAEKNRGVDIPDEWWPDQDMSLKINNALLANTDASEYQGTELPNFFILDYVALYKDIQVAPVATPVTAAPVASPPVMTPPTDAPVVPSGPCKAGCVNTEGQLSWCGRTTGCEGCPIADTCAKLCNRCVGRDQTFGGLDCGDCSGEPPSTAPVAAPTTTPVAPPVTAPSTTIPIAAPVSAAPTTQVAVPVAVPVAAPVVPSSIPSVADSGTPSASPITAAPSAAPSTGESGLPSASPVTAAPSSFPSMGVSGLPTASPVTASPSSSPSMADSGSPSASPVTGVPSTAPSMGESGLPSSTPVTAVPSAVPSMAGSGVPSASPVTDAPSTAPSMGESGLPSSTPVTAVPSSSPSMGESGLPSAPPVTRVPSTAPSMGQSGIPSSTPVTDVPSMADSGIPSGAPVTAAPSATPSMGDSGIPSGSPVLAAPSSVPSMADSGTPSGTPVTATPSGVPSASSVTTAPSNVSSVADSGSPTVAVTVAPPSYSPITAPIPGDCWGACNALVGSSWICSRTTGCEACRPVAETCGRLCDRCPDSMSNMFGGLDCDCGVAPSPATPPPTPPPPADCFGACDAASGNVWVCQSKFSSFGCTTCEDTDDVCAKLCDRCGSPPGSNLITGLACICP